MTPHQAVCHLSDAFRPSWARSRIVDCDAALADGDQVDRVERTDEMADRRKDDARSRSGNRRHQTCRVRARPPRLEALMEQFAAKQERELQPHPMFGRMTTVQWQRWGWLHMDHHLRQFGV
jgi:hypothetical protein